MVAVGSLFGCYSIYVLVRQPGSDELALALQNLLCAKLKNLLIDFAQTTRERHLAIAPTALRGER